MLPAAGSTEAVLSGDFSELKKGDRILIIDARKSVGQMVLNPWNREVVHLAENPKIEAITDPIDPAKNILTAISGLNL